MEFPRASILVTGPNRAARAFLADNLAADGHDVVSAPTAQTAWQLLESTLVDLVIVDVGGGGQVDRDALGLVARIRQSSRAGARVDPTTAVVVLSPRTGEVERLRIFDFGADELVLHPYSYPELRARLRALLRRARGEWPSSRVRVGPLELDELARQVWMDARPVRLSGKEFALLATLATEPSRVFTREELLERVWGFSIQTPTRTVDVHASRLRRKLVHPRERFVVNAWGEGYRLVAAVSAQESRRPGTVVELPAADHAGAPRLELVRERSAA